jgi:penicillin-binding protein 1C
MKSLKINGFPRWSVGNQDRSYRDVMIRAEPGNEIINNMLKFFSIKLSITIMCILGVTGCYYYFSLPAGLFDRPFSTVLLDRDGSLLGATIATDGQWRFPSGSILPEKVVQSILCFEDQRFYNHPGFDLLAICRAFYTNIKHGKIVSGASTITMQVIRLHRNSPPRTIVEKIIELFLAIRLEISKSKNEILRLYLSHAPFGGNVVGIEAASWRYFGKSPGKLTWAESAMLAVLPNSPALIHPSKNRKQLLRKRNKLLDKLYGKGYFDRISCNLSKNEPLPLKPKPLPMIAPHLLNRIKQTASIPSFDKHISIHPESCIKTDIIKNIQQQANKIVKKHSLNHAQNGIHNVAAIILEVASGKILAYVGNVLNFSNSEHGNYVDIITSPRSTGSILKPLLYAAMLQSGELLPSQLISDTPFHKDGFSPENFSKTFHGAVPAKEALSKSLNVPTVRMLLSFGVDRFYALLKDLGMTTLHQPANHYGLSLILGGSECTLWDITNIYAKMARILTQEQNENIVISPGACWLTFQSMLEVVRPGIESTWRQYSSSRKIAWKTGTSYGLRDGWAIGVTPKYAVGVWVGNADGEGRPGLTGIQTAGPVLFDLFALLDDNSWFEPPEMDLVEIDVCQYSGYRAGPNCTKVHKEWVHRFGLRTCSCPYCKLIHCNKTLEYRVHSNCERIAEIRSVKWFVLPPAMEWYYRRNHSDYMPLPPYKNECLKDISKPPAPSMTLIYPPVNSRIYIPVELDGQSGRTVFKAAHNDVSTKIYWHLDNQYIGHTKEIHQMEIAPEPGNHQITLVDENGEFIARGFSSE